MGLSEDVGRCGPVKRRRAFGENSCEASLRRGKCSNQYDYDEVILLRKRASFSSDVIESSS